MDEPPSISQLLDELFSRGGSDLIISAGSLPALRIDGSLVPYGEVMLTPEATDRMVRELLAPQ